jgi:hypothetical protein
MWGVSHQTNVSEAKPHFCEAIQGKGQTNRQESRFERFFRPKGEEHGCFESMPEAVSNKYA